MPTRPLGVGLTPLETRRQVVLHLADRAEALGYDAFFVAEGWGHDAGVLLAEVATRTERITLGTGVLNVWGRTAATVAMLAATLAEVSSDRFVLGLGAGSPPLAEGLHDTDFVEPVQRLGEMTRQVRGLLQGHRLETASGRDARPLRLAVTPGREIPVHLAALGLRSVRLAGEVADGWAPFLLPLSGLGSALGTLQEGAARRDPRRTPPVVAPCVPVAVSDDPATARELASWWVSFYLTSMGPLYRRTLTRLGHGRAVDEVVTAGATGSGPRVPDSAEGLLDELTLWGSPGEARAALDRWYAAGAQLPTVVLPPGRPLEELEHMLRAFRG